MLATENDVVKYIYQVTGFTLCNLAEKLLWVLQESLAWSDEIESVVTYNKKKTSENELENCDSKNDLKTEQNVVTKESLNNKNGEINEEKNLLEEDTSNSEPHSISDTKETAISDAKDLKSPNMKKNKSDGKKLIRPVPWLIFIPLLTVLRLSQLIVNILMVSVGKEKILAKDWISVIKNLRKKIKMVKCKTFDSKSKSFEDQEQKQNSDLPDYMEIEEYQSEEDSDYKLSDDSDSENSENGSSDSKSVGNLSTDSTELKELIEDQKKVPDDNPNVNNAQQNTEQTSDLDPAKTNSDFQQQSEK